MWNFPPITSVQEHMFCSVTSIFPVNLNVTYNSHVRYKIQQIMDWRNLLNFWILTILVLASQLPTPHETEIHEIDQYINTCIDLTNIKVCRVVLVNKNYRLVFFLLSFIYICTRNL